MLVAILTGLIFVLMVVVAVLVGLIRNLQSGMDSIYKKYKDAYNEMAQLKSEMEMR